MKMVARSNRWWERVEGRWHRVRYSDEPGRYFWDRRIGLFDITVESRGRGVHRVAVTGLDGSLDWHYEEEYRGSVAAAKSLAMQIAEDILAETLERLDPDFFGP